MSKAAREAQAQRRVWRKHVIISWLSIGPCKHADLAPIDEFECNWECSCGLKATLSMN